MIANETTHSSDFDASEDDLLTPSAQVQFWTYLILEIPSIICTIFLLYKLLLKRRLRRHLHNHVIIVLLFLCLIILIVDNSLYLHGWRIGHGNSFPSSSNLCLVWWFIDYGFYGGISVFLLWASFERHILVFHRRHFLDTEKKIFYIHYLPLLILSIYLIGFYTGVILFPPCKNIFDFHSLACGSYPCYQDISWLNTWDYLIHGVLCNILEALFSISLLIRTLWKKYYSQRPFQWKKYRKMTIQLLSISTLSLCITLPQSFIILIRQIQPEMVDFGLNIEPYFFYLTGYIILLLPYVCLGCLPELWPNFFHHQQIIDPMSITGNGQTVYFRGNDN